MQGFVEVMGMSDDQVEAARAGREQDAGCDLAVHTGPVLLAVSPITSVTPTSLAGVSRVDAPGGFLCVLGTVEEIRDKIAAAQAAPERAPVLPPRLRFEGPGGVSIVRISDITGIVPVPPGSGMSRPACTVHTTWGKFESYEPAEVLEARIDAQVRL